MIENKKIYIRISAFINYIYIVLLMISKIINIYIITSIGIITFCLFFYIGKKLKLHSKELLLFLLIQSINSSFVSIGFIPYSTFPLSWFFIVEIFILLYSIKNGINKACLFPIIIFSALFILDIVFHYDHNFINSFKQYINIILLFIIISCYNNNKIKHDTLSVLKYTYILSVLSYSLSIITQGVLFYYYNFQSGNILVLSNRISFDAIFSDYSFTSLYIASAFIILFVDSFNLFFGFKKIYRFIYYFILIISLLFINARTGAAALIISLILFLIYSFIKGKIKAIITLIIVLLLGISLAFIMVDNRGGQSFLDGSGRLDNYIVGLTVFSSNFLIGYGFGINNFSVAFNTTIPHNIIIQYLSQFGVIGLVSFIFGILPALKSINLNNSISWSLITIIIGSMLIPDIVSSHFFTVISIISIISVSTINTSPKYNISSCNKI